MLHHGMRTVTPTLLKRVLVFSNRGYTYCHVLVFVIPVHSRHFKASLLIPQGDLVHKDI
jgi:hypothetical protein